MTRVRIKFCGITRLEDAEQAVALGVDALGFVFYPESPRAVDVDMAARIIAPLPPFVARVGLFVNATADWVEQVCAQTGIDTVQYHGDESPERCAAGPLRWIKAVRVRDAADVATAMRDYSGACALLLDAHDPSVYGGTGRSFDWRVIPGDAARPLILAGGLHAGNVGAAVRQVRPFAIDVSGGIEVSKGVKDLGKMREFIAEVRRCE